MAIFKHPDFGEFEFSRKRLLNTEAILLEKVTGTKTKDLIQDFNENFGPLGVTAFVWLSMRRAGHHVKFAELEFDMGQLQYSLDDETDTPAAPPEDVPPDPPVAAPSGRRSTGQKTTAGSKPK